MKDRQLRLCDPPILTGMVQHNDKWKKKATREYHRKHGTLPTGTGRGRGRARAGELPGQSPLPDETTATEQAAQTEGSAEGSNDEASNDDFEQGREERSSKYARRKIESNAWRFESEQPDPYLSTQHQYTYLHTLTAAVIDQEEALAPPEPDYAHMRARPFETKLATTIPSQSSGNGVGRGVKKLTLRETELAPLKAQIDKANAARAFKERFSSSKTGGNILLIGQDGVARRPRRVDEDKEEQDSEIDDIDTFLAELDLKGDAVPYCEIFLIVLGSAEERPVDLRKKGMSGAAMTRDKRPDLDSFVDSLI